MIKDTDLITVRNRNNGSTGYLIPDRNIKRMWEIDEVKKVPFEELRAFSYMAGGLFALNNLLVIENKEALDLLNMKVEPEYFYTEEDIRKILFSGTIDEFADFLDFAPEGALEIAKTIAVKEEVPDVRKRDMLSQKTGFNINNAIMVNHVMDEEDAEDKKKEEDNTPKRRVKAEEPKTTDRRVAAPNYKVVTQN